MTTKTTLLRTRKRCSWARAPSAGTDASFGELSTIRNRHDNSGDKPGWFLEDVIVTDKLASKR
jgi:hypothetical protein